MTLLDTLLAKIVEDVITTDTAGLVVESIPVREADGSDVDAAGHPVDAQTVALDDNGIRVRIVDGQITLNSAGQPVAVIPMVGIGATILLSNDTIVESATNGTPVGTFSVIGGSGVYTFSEIADPGNKFALSGDSLTKNGALSWATQPTWSYTVQADNGVDDPVQATFTVNVVVLLAALGLDDTTPEPGVMWNATISGKSNGSTITATSSDGTLLTVVGNAISGTFSSDGTPNVTLHETHPAGTNSPRDTVVGLTVTDVLPIPEALWVSSPSSTPIEVTATIPDGVVVAGDAWEWEWDTVNTFDSGDLIEVDGVFTSGEISAEEVDATLPSLDPGLWYARFRAPGKTDWSNIISQTISGDDPFSADSTLITADSTDHTADEVP